MPVWGLPIRLIHWGLALAFAVAYGSGDGGDLHELVGYGAGVLVGARVVLGFFGPRPLRFSSFLRPLADTVAHLKDLLRGRALRSLGHTPAGAAMTVALLVLLGADVLTGYLLTTDAFWGSAGMERAHGLAVDLTLALIIIHVAGVLATSVLTRENLPRAMITGRKRPLP